MEPRRAQFEAAVRRREARPRCPILRRPSPRLRAWYQDQAFVRSDHMTVRLELVDGWVHG